MVRYHCRFFFLAFWWEAAFVELPHRVIEATGDCDPDQIRHEQQARDGVELPEGDEAPGHSEPEQDDNDECRAHASQAEKHGCPKRVEGNLHGEEGQGVSATVHWSDPSGGDGHGQVEKHPRDREQPFRWIPARFLERLIPLARLEHGASRGGSTCRCQENQKQCPIHIASMD